MRGCLSFALCPAGQTSLLTPTLDLAVDEMGGRLDELEKSISDLIQQAGVDDAEPKEKAVAPTR